MPQYNLKVTNQSQHPVTFCVYQLPAGPPATPTTSLIWLRGLAWPTSTCKFRWRDEYGFVCYPTGRSTPGTVLADPINLAADLTLHNQVTLVHESGTFSFRNHTAGAVEGQLSIRADASVAAGHALVGIGMAGAGTLVTPAEPNRQLVFTPPTYWVTAFPYQEEGLRPGEILDLKTITNRMPITFGHNTYTATARLDNAWHWSR